MMYLNVNLLIKHYGDLTPGRKQLLFYFYVYFEGYPPVEEPQAISYAGVAKPQFYMFPCSHGNIFF